MTILRFLGWFFFQTKVGKLAGLVAIGTAAFAWFVDEVGDRREAKVAPAIVKKVEKQVATKNRKAKSNADQGADAVHRCYQSGGVWNVSKGACGKR